MARYCHSLLGICLFALAFLAPSSHARRFSKAADAVRLQDIQALTFKDGMQTTHRRVSALPQLNCVGGSGCAHYRPPSVRCTNSGSSYSSADVEWTCKADLPPEFKLGSTEVVCEGYDSPDDDFVLKGSCGLEYRLLLTDVGQEKFGSSWNPTSWAKGSEGSSASQGLFALLFWVLFAGVAFLIIRGIITNLRNNGMRFGPGGVGRGFGGGGGGDDDPPPPYDPRPPRYSKPRTSTGTGWGFGRTQQQGQGWQPGFWTGAATGAAAGYFAGNRGSRNQQPMQERRYDPGEGSSFRPFAGSSRSGGSSFSSERYESTGFGGTRRR